MRALACVALLLCLALMAAPAAADPLALRHSAPDRAVVVEGGWPNLSVGLWLGPALGFAVDWRLPASAVSASVGTRKAVFQGPRHGAVDLFVAGGLLVPTIDPGLALTATPAIQLGKRSDQGHFTFGVAAPVEVLLAPALQLRVPVLLELRLGGNLGPFWLGVRGGAGPVINTPGAAGFTMQWSVWVRIPAGKAPEPDPATSLGP